MTKVSLRGIIALSGAAFLFGTVGVFFRLMGESFGTFSQHTIRCFLALVFFAGYFLIKPGEWRPMNRTAIKWLLLWALSGSLVVPLAYYAYNILSLGTGYFIFYVTLIGFGFVFGRLLFHERMDQIKWLALAFVGTGFVLIYGLSFRELALLPVLAALLAGVCSTLWNTLIKKVPEGIGTFQMITFDLGINLMLGVIGSILFSNRIPGFSDPTPWIYLVSYTAVFILSTILVVVGFRLCEVQIGSIILPTEVVFGALSGWLVFGEVLPLSTLVGGLLIGLAAVLVPLAALIGPIYHQRRNHASHG